MFKVLYSFLLIVFLCACGAKTGFYSPSFDGIESVYEKGQVLHSITYLDAVGRYVAYSPIKYVGTFADFKIRQFRHPSGTLAAGVYLPFYDKVVVPSTYIFDEYKTDKGVHFDGYLGYSRTAGYEDYFDYNSGFFFTTISSPINYVSNRYFGQLGFHAKSKSLKFDALYRRNLMDIQTISIKPNSEAAFIYVNEIAKNDPLLLDELVFKLSLGNRQMMHFIGFNVVLSNSKHDHYLNYEKMAVVSLGSSFLISEESKKAKKRKR